MRLQYTVTLLVMALTMAPSCLAVVHGIQPISNHRYDSSHANRDGNGNRDGYRYNGPAHKYLPAASVPTTEAVTTTGHWQPNPLQQQLPPYVHTFSAKPASQQQPQQSSFNGPYNMQYYEQQPAQQSSGNSWREDQHWQQQQSTKLQQLSGESMQREQLPSNKWQQQQQLPSNGWQQPQKQQPLAHSNWRDEQQQQHQKQQQQQQVSNNSWQQQLPSNAWQQPQKQLSDSNWRDEQREQQQQKQIINSSWQQQQPSSTWQQLEQRQQQLVAQHDSNMLHTFPFGGRDKVAAAVAAMAEPGASSALSAAAHSNRYVASELRDVQQLMTTQALPEPQQQQPFAAPAAQHSNYEQLLGGSTHYVQMQSNSYELPSSSYSSMSGMSSDEQLGHADQQLHGHRFVEQPPHYSSHSSPSSSSLPMVFQPSREFEAPYF